MRIACAGARQYPVESAWLLHVAWGGGGRVGDTGRAGTVGGVAAVVGWGVLFGGEARFFGCFKCLSWSSPPA